MSLSIKSHALEKHLFSFETFFVALLFSDQFKNVYPFTLIPDITLILAIVLSVWFALLYLKQSNTKFFTPQTLSFLLFSGWCLFSACWVKHSTYSISKVLCFGLYTLPAFLMAYFIVGKDEQRLKRFLYTILVLSFVVHCAAFKTLITHHWRNVEVLGNNYLVAGQTLGFGFIILFIFTFFVLKKNEHASFEKPTLRPVTVYCLLMLLCATFVYIQLHLGGRGPVVGVVLALVFFYMYKMYRGQRQLCGKHFVILSLSCIVCYFCLDWLLGEHDNHLLFRINKVLSIGDVSKGQLTADDSINLRLEYYRSAVVAFLKHPLMGVGFGGWAELHDVQYHFTHVAHDLRDVFWRHPHNIGLEVLAETGLVGGLFAIAFGVAVFKRLQFKQCMNSFEGCASVLLFLFSFFNALKSGDINDNILFFAMAGIVAARK